MRYAAMRAAGVWLAVLMLLAAPALAQRVALVIGNGEYAAANISRLPNPANDAADIARELRALGFQVATLSDASQSAMRRALREFARAAEGADQAIIFFAGHGVEISGENYMLPVDAEVRSERDVAHEGIRLRDAMDTVAAARRLGLVILDACRDDPFRGRLERSGGLTRSVSRGLARVEPRGSVLVAYAAREGTTAEDGRGRNSPFTAALLRHLPNRGLEVADLFREVRADVLEATGRRQDPTIYGQLGRERVFLSGVVPGAAAPLPPPPADRDTAFWQSIAGSSDPRDFRAYLEAFPGGLYAALARNRLEALERPPAQQAGIGSGVRPGTPAAPPPPPPPSTATGLEQQARDFAHRYYATWSRDNDTAMAFVREAYAPMVNFFGGQRSAAFIADQKRPFTERWPVRDYRIRAESLTASCDAAARSCTVSGLVDWDARSPARGAVSIGLASFTLGMSFPPGRPPMITSETSAVIDRR